MSQAQTFAPGTSGPDVTTYQILVVKRGLMAVQKGMRLNRAYTPKNLMRTAENITGLKFRARDYPGAIRALEALLPPSPDPAASSSATPSG